LDNTFEIFHLLPVFKLNLYQTIASPRCHLVFSANDPGAFAGFQFPFKHFVVLPTGHAFITTIWFGILKGNKVDFPSSNLSLIAFPDWDQANTVES